MLTEHAKTLLLHGAKTTGTMTGAFEYAWEEFYTNEVDGLEEFCQWIDKEIGGCSAFNIDNLYLAYKHPDNKYLRRFANEIKSRISRIK